jgi:hypothetical protein
MTPRNWKFGSIALLFCGLLQSPPVHSLPHTDRSDAELKAVWLDFMQTQRTATPSIEFPYQHCFESAADTHDLPVTLLLAVARGESDFNARARSSANAYGLMQILWPTTARHLGLQSLSQLYEPCVNVDAGTRYLKELLSRYQGDLHLALAAYNYGPGRIRLDAESVPDGARWYSAYIHRHLSYVLSRSQPAQSDSIASDYRDEGKLELIVFSRPYRAEAFIASMQRRAPKVRLDWFRADENEFRVVMLHADDNELQSGRSALRNAGFERLGP